MVLGSERQNSILAEPNRTRTIFGRTEPEPNPNGSVRPGSVRFGSVQPILAELYFWEKSCENKKVHAHSAACFCIKANQVFEKKDYSPKARSDITWHKIKRVFFIKTFRKDKSSAMLCCTFLYKAKTFSKFLNYGRTFGRTEPRPNRTVRPQF